MTKSVQVVFLLDIGRDPESPNINGDVEKHASVMRLLCLKLLTYFVHHRFRHFSNVRWGFALYNSQSPQRILVSRRQTFREFKLKELEDFEEQIALRLKNENDRLRKLDHSSNNKCNGIEEKPCNQYQSAPAFSHADNLNTALKELLCDFQWDSPDITSPVVGYKRKKGTDEDLNQRQNYVFVISKCPCTQDDLHRFLGCGQIMQKVNSLQVLRKLMSNSVFDAYCKTHKIRVFWLDVGGYYLREVKENNDGVKMICEALKKMSGTVLPVKVLFEHSNRNLNLPWESLLDWYLKLPNTTKLSKPKQPIQSCIVMNGIGTEQISCKVELMFVDGGEKLETPFAPTCDLQKLFVTSVVKKNLLLNVPVHTFACVAVKEDKSLLQRLLWKLTEQRLDMVINCNGDIGLFSPLSQTTGIFQLMDLLPCYGNESITTRTFVKNHFQDAINFASDEKCKEVVKFVETIVQNSSAVTAHGTNATSISTLHPFSFNYLTNWFIPKPVSHDDSPKPSSGGRQNSIKTAESQLLNKLRQNYKSKMAKSGTSTPPPPQLKKVLPQPKVKKVSRNLKVSERTSGIVSLGLAALQAQQQKTSEANEISNHKKQVDKKKVNQKHQRTNQTSFPAFCTNDENKLLVQLVDHYQETVENDQSLLTCAENIINVVTFHTKTKCSETCEMAAKQLLERTIFKSPATISKVYENNKCAGAATTTARSREYELQALLRMELLSAFPNNDVNRYIDQVVMLLRMLSLYSCTSNLGQFLTQTLLPNYSSTASELVIQIFEELNQPLPPELESERISDAENAPSPSFSFLPANFWDSETNSNASSLRSSPSTKRDKRKHSLPCHLNNLEGNQKRTISIPADKIAKLKPTKFASNSSGNLENTKKDKKLKNVRRSLFGSEDQNNGDIKKPTCTKSSNSKRVVLKTKTVADTPLHKQVSNANVQRQIRLRGRSFPSDLTTVIHETPSPHKGSSRYMNTETKRHSCCEIEMPQTPVRENAEFVTKTPNAKTIEPDNRTIKTSFYQLRKFDSSPAKLQMTSAVNSNGDVESSFRLNEWTKCVSVPDFDLKSEMVASTPISKGESSPSPLQIPHLEIFMTSKENASHVSSAVQLEFNEFDPSLSPEIDQCTSAFTSHLPLTTDAEDDDGTDLSNDAIERTDTQTSATKTDSAFVQTNNHRTKTKSLSPPSGDSSDEDEECAVPSILEIKPTMRNVPVNSPSRPRVSCVNLNEQFKLRSMRKRSSSEVLISPQGKRFRSSIDSLFDRTPNKSEQETGDDSVFRTPTSKERKQVNSATKVQYTSPSSLSLLHLTTSPVMCKK